MTRLAPLLCLLMPLAACVGESTAPPPGVAIQPLHPDAMTCGDKALQPQLLGKPESALADVKLPANHRIIHPDTAVTLDLQGDRLNVQINKAGIIDGVYCG
ncbi:I78 family peptidase inhibitor [Gemmobacter denitrificans]|uniref:I78 family peptidase inhibitor n=1 Tax=Gemmobacter denitrificans TaxID=3123040 RepID=A0ABU8C0X4_9RHOB